MAAITSVTTTITTKKKDLVDQLGKALPRLAADGQEVVLGEAGLLHTQQVDLCLDVLKRPLYQVFVDQVRVRPNNHYGTRSHLYDALAEIKHEHEWGDMVSIQRNPYLEHSNPIADLRQHEPVFPDIVI